MAQSWPREGSAGISAMSNRLTAAMSGSPGCHCPQQSPKRRSVGCVCDTSRFKSQRSYVVFRATGAQAGEGDVGDLNWHRLPLASVTLFALCT
eukprot:1024428-Prymnesium_polylepis.1